MVYIKGLQVSKLSCTSVHEDGFILANSADPDEIQHYVILSGSHCQSTCLGKKGNRGKMYSHPLLQLQ